MLGTIGMKEPVALAVMVLLSSSAFAQSTGSTAPPPVGVDSTGGPAREGNIYDHRDHQPTQGEVGGITQGTEQEVEKSVNDLLRQTDRLDKQSQQDEQGLSGSSADRH